jgi:chromosome segregation ATPase
MQQKYTTALQEKSEVEEKVERMLKEKSEAEEKDEKALKEKDEAEKMAQWIQMVIQNLYKEIPEVPMVVEATMEEQSQESVKSLKDFAPRLKTWNHAPCQGHLLRKRRKGKGQ